MSGDEDMTALPQKCIPMPMCPRASEQHISLQHISTCCSSAFAWDLSDNSFHYPGDLQSHCCSAVAELCEGLLLQSICNTYLS